MNKTYNILWGILLLSLTGQNLWAQTQRKRDSETYPYRNELMFGGGLHTRGYNFASISFGWMPKPQRSIFAQVEFAELKHPKERRHNYDILNLSGNNKSFIYGKQNNFYVLRMGCGERRYFTDKQHSKTVALAWSYSGGVALGLIKPYYLNLVYRADNGMLSVRPEAFSQDNQYKFLNPFDVDGAAGPRYGWDEVNMTVGGYAKTGIVLDWGAWNPFIATMEMGVGFDFFFRKVPIMVANDSPPVFVNLYANFYLGKRW